MAWRAGARLFREIWPLIQAHVPEDEFRAEFVRDLLLLYHEKVTKPLPKPYLNQIIAVMGDIYEQEFPPELPDEPRHLLRERVGVQPHLHVESGLQRREPGAEVRVAAPRRQPGPRRGHVVVCGCRGVGLRTVEQLHNAGVAVVVVADVKDIDPVADRLLAGWDIPTVATIAPPAAALW